MRLFKLILMIIFGTALEACCVVGALALFYQFSVFKYYFYIAIALILIYKAGVFYGVCKREKEATK